MKAWVLTLVLLVVACGGPSLLPENEVDLFEFGIETAPAWADGRLVTVRNSGEFPHTLVVTHDEGAVVYASEIIDPGEEVDLDLALEPGEYELSCRLVAQTDAGDLVDHFEEGMRSELVISE